jgi:hypothetical protein
MGQLSCLHEYDIMKTRYERNTISYEKHTKQLASHSSLASLVMRGGAGMAHGVSHKQTDRGSYSADILLAGTGPMQRIRVLPVCAYCRLLSSSWTCAAARAGSLNILCWQHPTAGGWVVHCCRDLAVRTDPGASVSGMWCVYLSGSTSWGHFPMYSCWPQINSSYPRPGLHMHGMGMHTTWCLLHDT